MYGMVKLDVIEAALPLQLHSFADSNLARLSPAVYTLILVP